MQKDLNLEFEFDNNRLPSDKEQYSSQSIRQYAHHKEETQGLDPILLQA